MTGRSVSGARARACAGTASLVALLFPAAAESQTVTGFGRIESALQAFGRHELAVFVFVAGVFLFAALTAIAYMRLRTRTALELAASRRQIADLRDDTDLLQTLLQAEPQVVVIWRDTRSEPEIIGDPADITGYSGARRALVFGSWLDPARAHAMDVAVDALRQRGEAFKMLLVSTRARHIEADGRPLAGAAVLRLRDITGVKLDYAALAEQHRALSDEVTGLRKLLDALPSPIWIRDAGGKLAYANAAYAGAVEAANAGEAVARNLELLDREAREQAMQMRANGQAFFRRLPVVAAGQRRVFDVFETGGPHGGAAGIGIDATDTERLRAALDRIVADHRRTLDQLATAVAIFGADERLVFHNDAYRTLFHFDAAFLDDRPTDSAILDRLRAERQLPEQADFRSWKRHLHEAYRASEIKEHAWHLPGGRTLRVVTAPNPEGGVTYLFDELTEKYDLESRHNALIQMQAETLDALTEAVAVFGSDGRLKLFNRAFAELWCLPADTLSERPHIETIASLCRPYLSASDAAWTAIQLAVTGLGHRNPVARQIELVDSRVLDGAAVPLPDGGSLVTFRDVSDRMRVERALIERNEALLAADALKNTFVSHVSYELRSPLTTIIGFAQLLDDPAIGPLNDKQRQYLSHITESSAALLAIINDILDLATIDAGAMTLELAEVDALSAIEAASEGLRQRLNERGVTLKVQVAPDTGSFVADEKRVRQVLFNLLSNAAGFSPAGSEVLLSAAREGGMMVFRIADHGPGVPPGMKERIFERFETHPGGSQHRGAGLGLSVVQSLMELHGGSITIDSTPGKGTVAVCAFPLNDEAGSKAAE